MGLQIRAITADEFEPFARSIEAAFGASLSPEHLESERAVTELDRTFGAFEDGAIVGGGGAFSLRMLVPGGAELPTAGVTAVGVQPSHRRRGVTTEVMRRLFGQARERGEPVAALFASEGAIYGRFGYGLASFICGMDLETVRSGFVRGYRSSGSVRLLSRAEAIPAIARVYEVARLERPGTVRLDEARVDYWFHEHDPSRDEPFSFAVHDGADGADAYVVYKIKQEWPGSLPHNELTVHDLQATSPQAYADMWRFVLDMDLVGRVTAWARPPDEPLLHLLAEPRRLRLTVKDGLWLRLVDVGGALSGRGYAGEGRLVLEVRDRFLPDNEGRWALEASADGAECRRTDAQPDLACSVNDLGAVFLGGATFHQLHSSNQVVELRAGALQRADGLFATPVAPWCPHVF